MNTSTIYSLDYLDNFIMKVYEKGICYPPFSITAIGIFENAVNFNPLSSILNSENT